jgi:hypothetical protein
MDSSERPADINHGRRRFFGVAGATALAAGATQLGLAGSAKAQAQTSAAGSAGSAQASLAAASTAFGPLKQVNAGVLNVG